MLALSPWVALSVSFACILPQFPNPPLQCQELSDKQVSVSSLQDVTEPGDNNCESCGKCGHLHGCVSVSEEEEEEEDVKIFHSEGDLF